MPARKQPRSDSGDSFSFADVVKLTNATRSNLIHWTNIGIIKPDIEDTAGPGYPRRFSRFNLGEVHLAALVNSLRVPVAVTGQAVREFRDQHELSEAVLLAGGASDTDERALTEREREAALNALVDAAVRRDRVAGAEGVKPRSFYARHLRNDARFVSEAAQRNVLREARAWRQFVENPRRGPSFALFVYPKDGYAHVYVEPLIVRDSIPEIAIVVNLAEVVHFVHAVAGRPL